MDRQILNEFIRSGLKRMQVPFVKEVHLHIHTDGDGAIQVLKAINQGHTTLIDDIAEHMLTEADPAQLSNG